MSKKQSKPSCKPRTISNQLIGLNACPLEVGSDLRPQKFIVLLQFKTEKYDPGDYANIRENRDRLPEVELLQFSSPSYAAAC